MSFDPKCYELAASFLSDEPETGLNTEACRCELAQMIQDTIEQYLEGE